MEELSKRALEKFLRDCSTKFPKESAKDSLETSLKKKKTKTIGEILDLFMEISIVIKESCKKLAEIKENKTMWKSSQNTLKHP